ncbi:MAG: aminoacetone oxidase family FAD-binding enzyme [Ruminococcus sp.]
MSNCKYNDVVIIGGGVSGLFLGAMLSKYRKDLKIAILEKQPRVGKKLLVTGNGRCNLTNMNITADMYHGSFAEGAQALLNKYPAETIIDAFNSLGLLTTVDSEGRVYPLSKQANSVIDVLRFANRKGNVDIINNSTVVDIKKSDDKIAVITNSGKFFCKKAVIATGSRSAPSTGADDSMLGILKRLGHNVTKLYPALCPVTVKSQSINSLKGIRVSGKVSITQNGNVLKSESGEIQFSDNSLSGICVFNLSRIANSVSNTVISVSLLPEITEKAVFKLLLAKKTTLTKDAKAEELLIGFWSKMIGINLLKECGIPTAKPVKDITASELEALSKKINNWQFPVVAHRDFSKSQVTAGGILGSEINADTMESKIQKNIHIIGEIIDCDGDCGGMNLQFAFATAYATAKELSKL